MKEVLSNIAKTSGAKFYTLIVSLIILTLTARWLGPEGRGQIAVVLTWAVLIANIGYFYLTTKLFNVFFVNNFLMSLLYKSN